MKIGILTFHSQLNYGGVLQAYALQEALRSLGHDPVIIDRWLESDNESLEQGYNHLGVVGWLKVFARVALGGWELKKYGRVKNTKRFLKEKMSLTPYHFVEWNEATKELGLDMIVVGSDQVWHSGDWGDPSVYLLDGAPKISAISYAASFGMKSIPEEYLELYKRGLARFSAISCREAEGVRLCEDLGFSATHVLDPTLLADKSVWNRLLCTGHSATSTRKLVCYFMDGDVPARISALEEFAKESIWEVEVFLDSRFCVSIPRNLKQLVCRYLPSKVKRRIKAGPAEFVASIAHADAVLTDSFHALMFSTIFNKNARFIRPDNEMRRKMFARIEEFADKCIAGPVFVDSVQTALDSFANGETISYNREEIDRMRSASLDWLKKAIGEVKVRDVEPFEMFEK